MGFGACGILVLAVQHGLAGGSSAGDPPSSRAQNLFPASERASVWGMAQQSWSVEEDVSVAPDGSRTADLIRRVNPAPAVLRRPLAGFPGTKASFGIHVKAPDGAADPGPLFFAIRNDSTAELLAVAELDLSSGILNVKSGKGEASVARDGWVHVCLAADAGLSVGDTVAVYFGSGHDHVRVSTGFLAWGMQLSTDTSCGTYVRTEDAAVTIESAGVPPTPPAATPASAPPPAAEPTPEPAAEPEPEPIPASTPSPAPASTPAPVATPAPQAPLTAGPAPLAAALPAPSQIAPAPRDLSQRVPALLASCWLRDLRTLATTQGADREIVAACVEPAMRAARLAPDRRESWDVALELAQLGLRDGVRAAAAARTEALAALARIDPADDVVRLARIEAAVAAQRSVDAQARALETMLDARNRVAVGDPVAARLALALSNVESARSNAAAAARWLRESIALDPSFPAARLASREAAGAPAVSDRALEVEMRPVGQTLQPLEPLRLVVRVRNASPNPLAIGSDAPIDRAAALRCEFMPDGTQGAAGAASDPVRIDRRLRLGAGEDLAFEFDASGTSVGRAAEADPLAMRVLRCSLAINPQPGQGGTRLGSPGFTAVAPHVQLAGVDVTPDWARDSLAHLGEPATWECARRVVLLSHALCRDGVPAEVWAADRSAWWEAVVKAWKALPPPARAWSVAMLPRASVGMQPLLDAIRADSSAEVLLSRLLASGSAVDPATVRACHATGDAALARLADALAASGAQGGGALVAPDRR